MKKLTIGNFNVQDIRFGETTDYKDGILYVNEAEASEVINPEGKLRDIKLHIVHPGDSVRILPVKAATEPRFRPDGRCLYPGYTGPVSECGNGAIYAMKNIAVLSVGKYSSMGDGVLDMGGPGAEYCYFSTTTNLVIYAERTNEKDLDLTLREEDEFRKAAHYMAEYLGKTLEGMQPDSTEEYCLEEKMEQEGGKDLPKVAFVMNVISQLDNGINDLFAGRDCHNMMTLLVHPNEILDGFLLGGMGLHGQSITTYSMGNLPIIKRLYAEHGKTIDFKGVILVPADVSAEMKQRNKIRTGEIAEMLGVDAAIVCEYGGGSNVDVDEFYNLAELESRGIKTVGMFVEHAGKMLVDGKADAIVTTGDTSTVVHLPKLDTVIGDEQSLIRDYYYGAWTQHDKYGPSLQDDGSIVVNTFALAIGGNPSGWLKRRVREY